MKKVFLLLAVALTATMGFAQDSQIYKAQEQLDEQKFEEAEATMAAVLANPKTKKLAYAYNVAAQAELRILNQLVEKMHAQQPLDTVKFFSTLNNAIDYLSKSWEIDNTPDEKGKVKAKLNFGDKYTIGEGNGNIVWMKKIIGYPLIAAQFSYNNNNTKATYDYYIKYLELPRHKMFSKAESDSIYAHDPNQTYPQVGYFATILAYQDKDYNRVLRTVDFAINSDKETTKEDGYQMKTTALLHKGDTVQWLATLKEAMENTNSVNFPRTILKYYYDKHDQAQAMKIADDFIAKAPDNKMAYYIKGVILMDENKDNEAAEKFNKALELDPEFVDAISNIGVIHFNEVREINKNAIVNNRDPKYAEQQQQIKNKLLEARGYFEKVESLAPDKYELWQDKMNSIDEYIKIVDNNLAEVAKLKK